MHVFSGYMSLLVYVPLFICDMSPSFIMSLSLSCIFPSVCMFLCVYVAPYMCCSVYILLHVYVYSMYVPFVCMFFNVYVQSRVLLPCVQSVVCMSSPFIHFAIGILQTFFSNFKQACRIGFVTNLKCLRNLARPPAGCQCSKKIAKKGVSLADPIENC